MPIIYTISNQIEIHVEHGNKSPYDFIVKYQEPGKRLRTPKHIHLITELIMIQEKTNYPNGTINLNLFKKFRNGADIFSIVSAATFR